MSYEHEKINAIQRALRALLFDIEGMYEGEGPIPDRGEPEEFFGPFSIGRLAGTNLEGDISISWPNLAISMRNARNALRDEED